MPRRFLHPLLTATLIPTILWLRLQSAATPFVPPPYLPPPRPKPPESTLQAYDYGKRGSRLSSAAIVSDLDIVDDPARPGQYALITIAKGPAYDDYDPDKYEYPGCTLLSALTGGFFEDTDSAQVILRWTDPQHHIHYADNLVPGPTLTRHQAANWQWTDGESLDVACVRLPIGPDALDLTVLVVYTDVLWTYTSVFEGPEDGPAVIASWDAARRHNAWLITPRDEVGLGASPGLSLADRNHAADDVRTLIESRSQGHFTLQSRNNIGLLSDPKDPNSLIAYDTGFDIIPKLPAEAGGSSARAGGSSAEATASSAETPAAPPPSRYPMP